MGGRVRQAVRPVARRLPPPRSCCSARPSRKSLFGEADPVGETVRIRRVPHQVIGVLERKGQSMIGQDQDDVVLIPITTARKRVLGGQQVKSRNVRLDHRARARRRRHGRHRAGDARPHAPAAQAVRQPGGRLLPAQPLRGARRAGGVVEGAGLPARRHRVGVAGRRRHRHHEHHAGVGHRAHARDRPAHGRRRARPRHPHAVPRRGRHARAHRRPDRHRRSAAPRRSRSASSPDGAPRSASRRCCSPSASPARSACSSASIRRARRRGWRRSTRCGTSSGTATRSQARLQPVAADCAARARAAEVAAPCHFDSTGPYRVCRFRRRIVASVRERRALAIRGGSMKILVVDDHPLILHALAQCCQPRRRRSRSWAPPTASETLTALARHPDCALVLLDLALPGAHGLDLLARAAPRLSAAADRRAVGDARPRDGRRGAGGRRARLHRQDGGSGAAARRRAHGAGGRRARHARHRAARRVIRDRRRRASTSSASRSGRAT